MDSDFQARRNASCCGGSCKIKLEEELDKCVMDKFKLRFACQKAILENSSKLKKQIHDHINELVEILRERENQLCLQIDEKCADQNLHVDADFARLYATAAKLGAMSNFPDSNYCVCFGEDKDVALKDLACQVNTGKNLKFIESSVLLKLQLKAYGHIVGDSSSDSSDDADNMILTQNGCLKMTKMKKSPAMIMRQIMDQTVRIMKRKSQVKKDGDEMGSNESLDSITSFEVIDREQEQKEIENNSVSETLMKSYPAYKNTNVVDESTNEIADANVPEDPTSSFREQLKRLRIHKSPTEKCHKKVTAISTMPYLKESPASSAKLFSTNQDPAYLIGFLQQLKTFNQVPSNSFGNPMDHLPLSKAVKPSETIQSSFNRFLVKGSSEEWLVSQCMKKNLQTI